MRFRAREVLPAWDRPAIDGGAIDVEGGRIAAVGKGDAGGGEDLGEVLVLPAFVNAHVHLELTGFAGRLPRAPLWEWIEGLVSLRRSATDEDYARGVERGIRLLLEGGCAAAADVTSFGVSPAILLGSPLRSLVLEEGRDFHDDAEEPFSVLAPFFERHEGTDALRGAWEGGRIRFGFSPHAPYTASARVYEAAAVAVRILGELQEKVPDLVPGAVAPLGAAPESLSTHLLECAEEREFWDRGTGPLRDLLARAGRLPAAFAAPGGSPVLALDRVGFLGRRTILAHGNYLDDAEIRLLAKRRASVAFCPGSHAFFGHAPYPLRRLLDAGVNVCLGTDSLASNDGLSMLSEARRARAAGMTPREALRAATEAGARATGLGRGRLEPGAPADWIAVEVLRGEGDAAERLLDPAARVVRTVIAGEAAWSHPSRAPRP